MLFRVVSERETRIRRTSHKIPALQTRQTGNSLSQEHLLRTPVGGSAAWRVYLERAFGKRDIAAVDLDALVKISGDTTQAFLREWVFRGIQFASEEEEHSRLRTHHFEDALAEMTEKAEGASRIVGFRV